MSSALSLAVLLSQLISGGVEVPIENTVFFASRTVAISESKLGLALD
jgi:hypothetical protein